MGHVCIITDDSVCNELFLDKYPDRLVIFPVQVSLKKFKNRQLINPKIFDFPQSLNPDHIINIVPPKKDEILNYFHSSRMDSHNYLVLSSSSQLPSIYTNMIWVVDKLHKHSCVHVMDTQVIQAGLTYLVEEAMKMSISGCNISTIEMRIRKLTHNIYSLLCIPNLSYLSHLGIIDPAQAFVSEGFKILPVFIIEDGRLKIFKKCHKFHQVVDLYINFITEFPSLKEVTIIHNAISANPEIYQLVSFIHTKCPDVICHSIPPTSLMAAMFGPDVFGMIIIENTI